jgi:hypothetical protein
MSNHAYINQLLITVTALAQSMSTAETLIGTYFDRGYGSGGSNEIVSNDLVDTGLSPADIANAITLFQQLQAFRNGAAVYVADYDATLNRMRQDM